MPSHDPTAGLPPEVLAYIRELETRNQQLTQRVEQLEELFRLAQLKRFAPSSEKLKDRVFDEAEQVALADPVEDDPDGVFALPDTGLPAVDGPSHQKRGRKPLPADLPRTRIEYDLPEDQKVCPCCQGAMHRMGEQTCEQLHIEVKASVLHHVRFKYACRHCERHAEHTPILIAPMPAQPLPGSNASPAMIATVMTAKYADGTPLYRMEDALGRSNIAVSRGTLAHWIIRPAELHLSRLYEALRGTLLAQSLIHGDETTVQVLKEDGKTAQSKSYMWVYRSAEASAEPVALFEYQPGRGQQYPQAFLIDEQAPQVLPESLTGKAISYTRNQWEYLRRYVEDGHAPIDNNVLERDIRPFTTGRKAWLFSDTVAGAKASAIIYSLMLTCRACNVEPYTYLLRVLTELPQRAADADISDLLPFNVTKPRDALAPA